MASMPALVCKLSMLSWQDVVVLLQLGDLLGQGGGFFFFLRDLILQGDQRDRCVDKNDQND